jgi:hypothetical protein
MHIELYSPIELNYITFLHAFIYFFHILIAFIVESALLLTV